MIGEHICLNCSLWIPLSVDIPTGFCKVVLYRERNWLKDAEKRYSDSCANFEPKSESHNESDKDFPFI
jgi:hypothetical protein